MDHITSLVMEQLQFNHFYIIGLWELSVAMATKPTSRSPSLNDFELILPKQHFYQIRVILHHWFLSCHLKYPPLKTIVAMAT